MMIIENNAKELAAMQEFHNGNRQEGLRLQEEFAAQFRAEYAVCARLNAIEAVSD